MSELKKWKELPVGGLPESVLSRAIGDVALDWHDQKLPMLDVVVEVLRGVFIMRVCAGVNLFFCS